jgi:hypothetical protein
MGAEIKITEDGALCCPWCGEEEWPCLHHGEVTVYERGEDAKHVMVTRVSRDKPPAVETVPTAGSGNPSARRNGLKISFWCEFCDSVSELTISQHKGQTLLDWQKAEKLETFGSCGCGSPIEAPGRDICFACYNQQQE